jgi:hypothetical protein
VSNRIDEILSARPFGTSFAIWTTRFAQLSSQVVTIVTDGRALKGSGQSAGLVCRNVKPLSFVCCVRGYLQIRGFFLKVEHEQSFER